MLTIFGLSNDRAQLCVKQASASDIATARLVAGQYAQGGLLARICSESALPGRTEVMEEVGPLRKARASRSRESSGVW